MKPALPSTTSLSEPVLSLTSKPAHSAQVGVEEFAESESLSRSSRFRNLVVTGGGAALLFLATATISQIPTPATADIRASFRFNGAARQCADLIAPCLAIPESQRPGCLFEVSLDSHCEGSELGGLAFRRWASETAGEGEPDLAEAFSGADEPMNRSCVEKFDQALADRLKSGQLSSSEIYQLSSALDSCRIKSQNPDLLRP